MFSSEMYALDTKYELITLFGYELTQHELLKVRFFTGQSFTLNTHYSTTRGCQPISIQGSNHPDNNIQCSTTQLITDQIDFDQR